MAKQNHNPDSSRKQSPKLTKLEAELLRLISAAPLMFRYVNYLKPASKTAFIHIVNHGLIYLNEDKNISQYEATPAGLTVALALAADAGPDAPATTFGPIEPPNDPRIFNRKQSDGTYRPLADFFNAYEKPDDDASGGPFFDARTDADDMYPDAPKTKGGAK